MLGETSSRVQQKALLLTATKDQLKTIIEVAFNLLHLNIPVSKTYQAKLVKRQSVLKALVDRRKSQKELFKFLKKNLSTVILIVKAALPGLVTLT